MLLERVGLSPADLVAAPRDRAVVPTFAEYVPVASAAVSAGTRRAYGSYWNCIVEHWAPGGWTSRPPSEIRQLMTWVKTHVVARRNARGGRSAQEHVVAALPVPARGRGRADQRGRRPGPQGGQAAAAAVHPPGAGPAPARPGPGSVPDPAPGERRDSALAAGLPHLDGPPGAARPGAPCPGRRAAAAVRRRAAGHVPPV